MKYSKGVSWVQDCRIPFVDDRDKDSAKPIGKITTGTKDNVMFKYNDDKTRLELPDKQSSLGRFTPNLLVCDDMLNDGSVSKSEDGKNKINEASFTYKNWNKYYSIGDKGSNSRYYDLDLWFDKMIEKL